MDKIHEKSRNFFIDACKRKIGVNKNIRIDTKQPCDCLNLQCRSCIYCQKIFINSRLLLKHIMRRHTDDLISLYKKSLKCDYKNNSDDFRNLISFLETEFLTLKNEFLTVKQTISDRKDYTELSKESKINELQENAVKIDESPEITGNNIDIDIETSELNVFNAKMSDVERDIQSLHCKFEELDVVLKNEVLLKQDISKHIDSSEEKILKAQKSQFMELKQNLLHDLESVLFNQLYKNDSEWKSRFLELTQEIKRLELNFDTINKQINFPESAKKIEKNIEQHLIHFVGTKNYRSRKLSSSRSENKLIETKTHCSPKGKKISKNKKLANFPKLKEKSDMSFISPSGLSFLLAEKLSQFNIAPNTSKMSCAEYNEKMKLINVEKERLHRVHGNFHEIHNNINMCADHAVQAKLENQTSRKIRFSEPLVFNKRPVCAVSSGKHDNTKVSPELQSESRQFVGAEKLKLSEREKFSISEKKTFLIPRSEEFSSLDVGASGDGFRNSPDIKSNPIKEVELNSFEKFKTSSPSADICRFKVPSGTISKDFGDTNLQFSGSNKAVDYVDSDFHVTKCLYDAKTPVKKFIQADYCYESDDDKSSLKSLSSWECEDDNLKYACKSHVV